MCSVHPTLRVFCTHSAPRFTHSETSLQLPVRASFTLCVGVTFTAFLFSLIEWCRKYYRWLESASNNCRGCRSCLRFPSGVDCIVMTVFRTDFSRTFSATRHSPSTFFRTWNWFGVRCCVKPAVDIWGCARNPVILKVFVRHVTRGVLGLRVVGPRLLGTDLGSSTLILPSSKYYFLRTTSAIIPFNNLQLLILSIILTILRLGF